MAVPPPPSGHSPANEAMTPTTPATPAISSEYFGESIAALVEFGFSNDDVLLLSKLSSHAVLQLNIVELLDPLQGVPEAEIVAGLKVGTALNGRHAATRNTPAHATLLTRRPLASRTSTKRSATLFEEPTDIARNSKRKQGTQRYCPDCRHPHKNSFEKHFYPHLPDLLNKITLSNSVHLEDFLKSLQYQLLACGYCSSDDSNFEKAFLGHEALVQHVKEVHSKSPNRLQWSFNDYFKNTLFGEVNLHAQFHALLSVKYEKDSTRPVLCWRDSDETRALLIKLQAVGGKVEGFNRDRSSIDNLLSEVYAASLASVSAQSPNTLGRPISLKSNQSRSNQFAPYGDCYNLNSVQMNPSGISPYASLPLNQYANPLDTSSVLGDNAYYNSNNQIENQLEYAPQQQPDYSQNNYASPLVPPNGQYAPPSGLPQQGHGQQIPQHDSPLPSFQAQLGAYEAQTAPLPSPSTSQYPTTV